MNIKKLVFLNDKKNFNIEIKKIFIIISTFLFFNFASFSEAYFKEIKYNVNSEIVIITPEEINAFVFSFDSGKFAYNIRSNIINLTFYDEIDFGKIFTIGTPLNSFVLKFINSKEPENIMINFTNIKKDNKFIIYNKLVSLNENSKYSSENIRNIIKLKLTHIYSYNNNTIIGILLQNDSKDIISISNAIITSLSKKKANLKLIDDENQYICHTIIYPKNQIDLNEADIMFFYFKNLTLTFNKDKKNYISLINNSSKEEYNIMISENDYTNISKININEIETY